MNRTEIMIFLKHDLFSLIQQSSENGQVTINLWFNLDLSDHLGFPVAHPWEVNLYSWPLLSCLWEVIMALLVMLLLPHVKRQTINLNHNWVISPVTKLTYWVDSQCLLCSCEIFRICAKFTSELTMSLAHAQKIPQLHNKLCLVLNISPVSNEMTRLWCI